MAKKKVSIEAVAKIQERLVKAIRYNPEKHKNLRVINIPQPHGYE
jgi:broad specificity polyphosphatase/5'/3'-nucleotidase SurE